MRLLHCLSALALLTAGAAACGDPATGPGTPTGDVTQDSQPKTDAGAEGVTPDTSNDNGPQPDTDTVVNDIAPDGTVVLDAADGSDSASETDSGPPVVVAASVGIAPIGTDIVVVGQAIPLKATAFDADGVPIEGAVITWSSSLPEVLEVEADGVVYAHNIGGAPTTATTPAPLPDGTLKITAMVGDATTSMTLMVVRLNEASGIEWVSPELSDDDAPVADGSAHYDGIYPTGPAEEIVPCETLYIGDNWNYPNTCEYALGDARVFVGRTIQLHPRGYGKFSQTGKAWLDYDVEPATPRPLYVEWTSANPAVATIVEGTVTAISPGVTTVSATIGPQTWSMRLVVYSQFGYDPANDYAEAATPEDGHLVVFSSSAAALVDGTMDTVRYVDLSDYSNLDHRPSKPGPQGVRLAETLNNAVEKYPGFGCGWVQGRDDTMWLLNGWTATPFDRATATQVGNLNKAKFRDDGVFGGEAVNAVCQAVFIEGTNGRDYLVGFDRKPYSASAFWIDVTDIDSASPVAVPVAQAIFNQIPVVAFYSPVVVNTNGSDYVAFMEQTSSNGVVPNNTVHFAEITFSGNQLVLQHDPAMAIETAPTPNVPVQISEAPPLFNYTGGGNNWLFVGNENTVTVIDLATHAIMPFGAVGSPLTRDIDTRRFGRNVRHFAMDPAGENLYFVPENGYGEHPFLNTDVEWGDNKSATFSVHRIGIIDLTGATPRLRVDSSQDPAECFLANSGCSSATDYQYGYDLNAIALKQSMLEEGITGSTGALPPPLAMNISSMAVSSNSIFLTGFDNADGIGTALGNASDVAVIDLASGRMPIFRGWRGNPGALQGLSDPFGFRLAPDDAVMAGRRVKNAAIMYVPGAPPAENAGDGWVHPDDAPMNSDNYADAPTPATEAGRLVLLSSSHKTAGEGTFDVIRELDLGTANWPETDFDPAVDGAQGRGLSYEVMGTEITWRGGCGSTRLSDGTLVWFNGDAAIFVDPNTVSQAKGGHQVTFDPNPAVGALKICTGVAVEIDGKTFLYGVNMDSKPLDNEQLWVADITDIASGNVTATNVVDAFFAPYPGASPAYDVRYVDVAYHDGELLLLEPNDPWNNLRNTVHRATVNNDGSLTFDARPPTAQWGSVPGGARDLTGAWTATALPGLGVADIGGVSHVFIGNETSITVYAMTASGPERLNYNTDGDGIADDIDTAWFGKGIQAFKVSPDGQRLFALPAYKSGVKPSSLFEIPQLGGGSYFVNADRYRMVAIDLNSVKPDLDQGLNGGNGVDLNYYWFKRWIAAQGPFPLPPTFPFFRREFAASNSSLFLLGNDHPDGEGSALANIGDLATYDIASGAGHLWRDYQYEGITNASGKWGYNLGIDVGTGLDDANLVQGSSNSVAKNAAVLFISNP